MTTTAKRPAKIRPAEALRFQYEDGTIVSTRSSKPKARKLAKRLALQRERAAQKAPA